MTSQIFFSGYITPPSELAYDIILVAGGGGSTYGTWSVSRDDSGPPPDYIGMGGGGGGGVLTHNGILAPASSLYLYVGAGGPPYGRGADTYYSLTAGGADVRRATGGGCGYTEGGSGNGGSGGGGYGGNSYWNQIKAPGTGIAGQGYAGGVATLYNSAGGGGAAGPGGNSSGTTSGTGGAAGPGYNLNAFDGAGSNLVGGGGAGVNFSGVNGSLSGNPSGQAGPANTGRGANSAKSTESNGGSGVVIVRYPGTTAKGTGGSTYFSTVGGTPYVFHRFTGSGTFTYTA